MSTLHQSPPPRPQTTDYAHLTFHGETAGRLSPWFASAAFASCALSFAITWVTAGSWHPILQAIAFYSLLSVPLACLAATISSVRGLVYPSRYRTRSIVGLVLAALALLTAATLLGWMAQGYR